MNDFLLLCCSFPPKSPRPKFQNRFSTISSTQVPRRAAHLSRPQFFFCLTECFWWNFVALPFPRAYSQRHAESLPAPASSSTSPPCVANWAAPPACTVRVSFFQECQGFCGSIFQPSLLSSPGPCGVSWPTSCLPRLAAAWPTTSICSRKGVILVSCTRSCSVTL